jgi:hypothetical protein
MREGSAVSTRLRLSHHCVGAGAAFKCPETRFSFAGQNDGGYFVPETHGLEGCGLFRLAETPNPDSSVDVYFGPQSPAGKESNWIQTVPGKGWFQYCGSTVRSSLGSIRPGARARSNWSNDWKLLRAPPSAPPDLPNIRAAVPNHYLLGRGGCQPFASKNEQLARSSH